MKKILLTTLFAAAAHLAPMACAATEYTLPQLPDGIMPNTEVTTNLPLHVKAERVREFGLTLDAGNCVSNEVLVAIGCDADGNGEIVMAMGDDLCSAHYVKYGITKHWQKFLEYIINPVK